MARIEPAINKGALLQLYSAMWGPMYEAVLNILGSTGTILPMGDSKHGQPNSATFTTVGGEQVVFTWSEAPASFDTPLDLTDPASFQGIIPIVTFNGADEEADSPDADYWTRALATFSVGVWVNLIDATSNKILVKDDATTGSTEREWYIDIDTSDNPRFVIFDDSAASFIGRKDQSALSENAWHFLVGTYDGGTAASSIKLYLDGAQVDDADVTSGSFTSMENKAAKVKVGFNIPTGGGTSELFDGYMAGGPLGPLFTHKELTADEVLRLYELGRRALGL